MEFRTHIDIKPFARKIDYSTRGLSMGSCFAENIAARLERAKFPITNNPFGVLYNPASIAEGIDTLHSGRIFTADDLVREGDLWSCFSFHGSFSATDPQKALGAMNGAVEMGADALKKADYVVLTFGTAWAYELDPYYMSGDQDENLILRAKRLVRELVRPPVVANCHKFPARAFNRRRLEVSEIVDIYSLLMDIMLKDKHVILTVSPVRHIKDGMQENNVSKATLLLAAAELAQKYDNVDYFPAFEIVNDELRDYRFYKEDMAHPSDQAVDYVWELFGKAFFAKKTNEALGEVLKIVSAAEHRPLNPGTASHRRFLHSMLKKAEALQKKYPAVDLSRETNYFKALP